MPERRPVFYPYVVRLTPTLLLLLLLLLPCLFVLCPRPVVVGGGYDFAQVEPLLLSLSNELPQGAMATLQAELMANGNGGGQLGSSISDAVPNVISVFFDPAASDVMMEAAINDILDKLKRDGELLRSGSIAKTVLGEASQQQSSSQA